MNRRKFLGAVIGTGLFQAKLAARPGRNVRLANRVESSKESDLLDRVKTAMLTMQRQAWEQGWPPRPCWNWAMNNW